MASATILASPYPADLRAPLALHQRIEDFKCDTGDAELDSLLLESAFESINGAICSVASIAEDAEAVARRGKIYENDLENTLLLQKIRALLRATEILYF